MSAGSLRHQGRLTEWNDDSGFGFVTPLDGGPRVFVHVSGFPRDKRRPVVMDLITYRVGQDQQGRPCAQEVLFLTPTRAARIPRSASPAPSSQPRVPAILVIMAGRVVTHAGPVRDALGRSASHSSDAGQLRRSSSGALFVVTLMLVPFAMRSGQVSEPTSSRTPVAVADDAIAIAFRNGQSGVQVSGQGVVERVLSDDTDGSRHQRFILRLPSGQTLLVAHNIDLAPRITALGVGDSVVFYGEYEWNSEGGVIHWTHHDPDGSHVAGWLKHNGQTFQ